MTMLAALLFALQQGESLPPPSLEPLVTHYAQQLRDGAARSRARDRLVHLGRPALALLEKADVDAPALSSIRQEIAFNETLGAAYGPPRTFTFDADEETLATLLQRLENGAGVTYRKNSLDLGQKFSLRLEDATYWEALDEVCRKASIWYFPANDEMYLNSGMATSKPRVYYGPLMLILDRVIQQRKVTFEKIESEMLLRLMFAWEKQVLPLGPTGRYQLHQVTDDTGASLLPAERPAPPARPLLGVRVVGATIDFAGLLPPSAGATKLTRVEGTVELEFPARIDETRIVVVPENPVATREIEGAVVELKSFAPSSSWGSAAEFQIRFKDAKEAATFRIGTNDLEFISGGESKRGWIGATQRDPEKGTFTFTAHYRQAGRQELPKEIRLRIPRGSVIKNVPFCYKDVELK